MAVLPFSAELPNPYRGAGPPVVLATVKKSHVPCAPMIKRAVHWLVFLAVVLYVVGFIAGQGLHLPGVPF